MIKISDAEWKIVSSLWDQGPMTITELTRHLKDNTGWNKNTIINRFSCHQIKNLRMYFNSLI